MVSIEATERAHDVARRAPSRRDRAHRLIVGCSPVAALGLIFVTALVARLLARDVVITADEDNWMRRAGGFTYGLLNGQYGRTYQNGHPGVTTMWVAMLTLGPERMVQYADRVHNQRLVGRVPGFWDALVDARPGFALVTAVLVTLIAGLAWRLFGPLVGVVSRAAGGAGAVLPGDLAARAHGRDPERLHGGLGAGGAGRLDAGRRARLARGVRGAGRAGDPLEGAGGVPAGVRAGAGGCAGRGSVGARPGTNAAGRRPRLPAWSGRWRVDLRRAGASLPAPRSCCSGRRSGCSARSRCWAGSIEFTRETGGQPHEQGTFFWGQQTADPGPLFYPVAMAFRLAPVTVLGLVLLAVCWRRLAPDARRPALALDRVRARLPADDDPRREEARPVRPADLPGAGGAGGARAGGGVRLAARPDGRGRRAGHRPPCPLEGNGWCAGRGAGRLARVSTYPYYLSYYNPLLGGGPAAQRTVMVGNGEGLDQVAEWLNAQPGRRADHWVVSHSFDILQALIVGVRRVAARPRAVQRRLRGALPLPDPDRAQSARPGRVPEPRTPEHVVWINGDRVRADLSRAAPDGVGERPLPAGLAEAPSPAGGRRGIRAAARRRVGGATGRTISGFGCGVAVGRRA